MNWFLLGSIMFSILTTCLGVALIVGRRQEQRERYHSIIASKKTGVGEGNKDKSLAKQRAEIARKLKEAGKDEEKKKDAVSVRMLIEQAGFETPESRYWTYSAVFALFVWIFLKLVTSWPLIGIILATFTAFLGVPRLFLKKCAEKRQKKFLAEFSDVLDSSVRLLQAGMPITEAIAMASREYTGPIQEEMTRIYENQKIGVALGAAALQMAKRVPLTEVHMFATALQIQSETGSSLSEVLNNLSAVIRARFRLKRKVKALSSEAKASAMIIGCLPLLVCGGLYVANPDYISLLFTTPRGHVLLTVAICWMSCGIFVMKQMINFKI